MRRKPDATSEIIAQIPQNAMFVKQTGMALELSQGKTPAPTKMTRWVPVEYHGKEGYVDGAFLLFLTDESRASSFAILQEVIRTRPELANSASPAGRAFLERFQKAKESNSTVLKTAEWPVRLTQSIP
jgi:hypothetical protein